MLDEFKQFIPEWCRLETPPPYLKFTDGEDEDTERFLMIARRDSIQMNFLLIVDQDEESDPEDPDIVVAWENDNHSRRAVCIKKHQIIAFMEDLFDKLPLALDKAFAEAENFVDDLEEQTARIEPEEPLEDKDEEAEEGGTSPAQDTPPAPPSEEPKAEDAVKTSEETPKAVCVDDLPNPPHVEVPNPQTAPIIASVDPPAEKPSPSSDFPAEASPRQAAPLPEPPVTALEPPTPPPAAPLPPPPVKPLAPPTPPPVTPFAPPTPPTPQQSFVRPQPPPQPVERPALTRERMALICEGVKMITQANFPYLGKYRWTNEDKGETIEYTPVAPPQGGVQQVQVGLTLIYTPRINLWEAVLTKGSEAFRSTGPTLNAIKDDYISLY